jgi:hypothetical protein
LRIDEVEWATGYGVETSEHERTASAGRAANLGGALAAITGIGGLSGVALDALPVPVAVAMVVGAFAFALGALALKTWADVEYARGRASIKAVTAAATAADAMREPEASPGDVLAGIERLLAEKGA